MDASKIFFLTGIQDWVYLVQKLKCYITIFQQPADAIGKKCCKFFSKELIHFIVPDIVSRRCR